VRHARKVRKYFKRRGLRNGVMVALRRQLARDAFRDQQMLLTLAACTNEIVFDVGANRGDITHIYAGLFPRAAIHSFEPFPTVYERLHNRFQNDDRIHAVQAAVCDREGPVDFYVTPSSFQNSLYEPMADELSHTATSEVITVPGITLDTYCAQNGIEHVNLLKLDIQGGEVSAFKGASELLKSGRVDMIYTEMFVIGAYQGQALFYDIAACLAEHDYTLFHLYNVTETYMGQMKYCDAIFLSAEMRESLTNNAATREKLFP
jgi:FkbM family methyltransferase